MAQDGYPRWPIWPHTDKTQPGPGHDRGVNDEPSSFVYSVADDYEAVSYFCHDPLGKEIPTGDVLNSVKNYVAAGVPAMFGFFGFPSANQGDVPGSFPFPCPGDKAIWGHAVVAVGYNDALRITNKRPTGPP